MFLTLLQNVTTPVKVVTPIIPTLYPEEFVAKPASYRIRELVYEATKAENSISLVYSDTLRAIRSLFTDLKIVDSENKAVSVKCITGNPERIIAKLSQEDNLILPIISVTQPSTKAIEDRQKYAPLIISESAWNPRTQRAVRIVSLASKPVDITYRISILAKYKIDLDQLSEQIYNMFHPSRELKNSYSNVTKAILKEEKPESVLNTGDREDRVLIKNFSIVVETYIPTPKFVFSSTGKLEKFYSDMYTVSSLPITQPVFAGKDLGKKNILSAIEPVTSDPVPEAKSADYRIRELVYESSKDTNNISYVFRDILKATKNLFSKFKILNQDGTATKVNCIYANPERPVAKIIQEDNLILPIVSISQPENYINQKRQKYMPMIISEKVWDDRLQRARRVVSLVPKPVDISYKITLFCKYKNDLDQITEQIYSIFNPSHDLQSNIANVMKAILVEETDESAMQIGDREDRVLMKSFSIHVETYIPMPKFMFSATGKIEKFYYDLEAVKEIE